MTNAELLKIIRGLDHIQLNRTYSRQYVAELQDYIRMAKARNRVGIRGYPKHLIRRAESTLRNLDKKSPFISKIKVEIG